MSIAKLIPTMLSLTTPVHSATYYVAQGAPNASDENPGSVEKPWKTLTHAAEMAQEGDTVYIKAGTYRQQLQPENDGVTFLAFGDDRVVLLPDDKITVIEPSAWSKAPDQEFVYVCKPEVEGGWPVDPGNNPPPDLLHTGSTRGVAEMERTIRVKEDMGKECGKRL